MLVNVVNDKTFDIKHRILKSLLNYTDAQGENQHKTIFSTQKHSGK